MDPTKPPAELKVTAGSDPRILRILTLIDEAARPRPLPEVLGTLCTQIVEIMQAQVASLYVRSSDDDDEHWVMSANVGFRGGAIGQVKLKIGEGITGFAAECMRPLTMTVDDTHYKYVPDIGEERYPLYLATPIVVGRRSEAVLVLQREIDRPFQEQDVVLGTALSTAFAYALERSRLHQDIQEDESVEHRMAHLNGVCISPGRALGRVESLPTFDGLAALARARGFEEDNDAMTRGIRLRQALEAHIKLLGRATRELREHIDDSARAALTSLELIWQDQRFLNSLEAAAAEEINPCYALRRLGREYAKVPFAFESEHGAQFAAERSREIETLCLQIAARVVDERFPSRGSVLLLTDGLPALLVLHAHTNRSAAIALSSRQPTHTLGVALALAAKLPIVAAVGGLFAWSREGDRLLMNAETGAVHINPGSSAIAGFRQNM